MNQSTFVEICSVVFEPHRMPEKDEGLEHPYPLEIKVALAEARAGCAFAPFDPKVLHALSATYKQSFDAWRQVRRKFKQANQRIPLHDLDRAMTALVPTRCEAEVKPNYSVTIGKALAHAKAGCAKAPFAPNVIAALAKLRVSSPAEWKRLRLQFKGAHPRISLRRLEGAVRRALSIRNIDGLHQPINAYVFDREDSQEGEMVKYWVPISHTKVICVPESAEEFLLTMPPLSLRQEHLLTTERA